MKLFPKKQQVAPEPLLDKVSGDSGLLKQLDRAGEKQLCAELRRRLIDVVAVQGGHLAPNLGVVELTVALHRAFDLPRDKIVWDVGHQCYVHKLLTGRADRFDTLRAMDGITGFPNPHESPCDPFVVGHSSTAVSAANGIAKAAALTGADGWTVAVLGDGALTGGLAYEGLSNAGRSHDRLIVVLNDNRMAISQNVGFVARHLTNLRSRPRYVRFKNEVGRVVRHIPLIGKRLHRLLWRTKFGLKRAMYDNSTMFEEMGFYYLGPVDGHDLKQLERVLTTAKAIDQPTLVHVETQKGHGYPFAQKSPDAYHCVGAFDPAAGVDTAKTAATFSATFGEEMLALAQQDDRLCVVTAAMEGGTGLTEFARRYHKRCFDVGIAEEHAVTFSSGLASQGMRPVFAVYSSFLQRCYDQLLNDTALMHNHIVLAIDRAGVVPGDGETHQGIFDVPLLTTVPHTSIYAPSTREELRRHLRLALYREDGIAAVRYPKGDEPQLPIPYTATDRPYAYYKTDIPAVLAVTYGRTFGAVLTAAETLTAEGAPVAVLKLNRIFPLPEDCLEIVRRYSHVLFVEEGSRRGGIGEILGARLMEKRFGGDYRIHAFDGTLPVGTTEQLWHRFGMDADGIAARLREFRPAGGRP